jgi:predicted nucleic-acid-binding protein
MKNEMNDLIVELTMENKMSIQDLLRAANDLTEDYASQILVNKKALSSAYAAQKAILEAIRLLNNAVEIENNKDK